MSFNGVFNLRWEKQESGPVGGREGQGLSGWMIVYYNSQTHPGRGFNMRNTMGLYTVNPTELHFNTTLHSVALILSYSTSDSCQDGSLPVKKLIRHYFLRQ